MAVLVNRTTEDGIAILEIANPPVNALAQPVRTELLAAVLEAERDPAVRGVVICGAGRCFVAGADLREFDVSPRAPLLNDVLLKIEGVTKPVLAALHGTTLGGGLELALACHYRCAVEDASVGFPEIKLALMPGSGGTQRLPRLVGARVALDMMLSGESLTAARALELGIIDRLVAGPDLGRAAARFLRELIGLNKGTRPLRDIKLRPSAEDLHVFAGEREPLSLRGVTDMARSYIIECVEAAYLQPFDAALALSRRRFEECRQSLESRALRHLFFAERAATGGTRKSSAAMKSVAVIGAGTMGSGIAVSLATSGYRVVMIDSAKGSVATGLERVIATIEAASRKGRITSEAAGAAAARVTASSDLAAAASADLVIEAVFESMSVKQEVFRSLDRICRPETILATNTSTLDVDVIASATARPQCVVGMHFFSPAHVMRLVEIIRGAASSPETIAAAMTVTRCMGKIGVVVGNCFGFVGNRMLYAYGRENQIMLLEGASPSQIDSALQTFGMAMGPNAVGDLAGLDVGYRVRRERADRPVDPRYFRVADALVEAGRLGQKSGRGAFRYEPGSRKALADPEVESLIKAESARLGIEQRAIADAEIVARCTNALVNEGAAILGEGIARSAADIDAIWCNGYGFPRRRGGPMFYADTVGLPSVVAGIERFSKEQGAQYWTTAPLLEELARSGRSFAEWDRNRPETPGE